PERTKRPLPSQRPPGTLSAVTPTTLTANQAESLDFWRTLQPSLSIEGKVSSALAELGSVDELVQQLRFEGYINQPGALGPAAVEPLRACIAALHARQIPLPFAFVYDQFWQVFQGLSSFLSAALGSGYRALPDFWVWHVPATEQAMGWGPHRDRVQPTLDRDNSPHSLTVWLPFSDATPLNGCIYVLPAHLDERFELRRWDGDDNNQVKNPQNIRALPASAGSVLAWNQAVLHWGGRASRLAAAPRASAAFEFQRGDRPAFNQPLLDPKRTPTFRERLGLIGKQVLQYQHMYPLTPDVQQIAELLRDKHMPSVASLSSSSPVATSGSGGGS
ncbi:MAG TPA: phytanoyl-CoA dioxygenase family protein, partial [Polyangiaceae bacterium]